MFIGLSMAVILFIILSIPISSEPTTKSEPPDFYGTSKEVTFEEMIEVANKYELSIYLPTDLPKNLQLVTIYLKESPFIAIIVYSAEGNRDYKTAELTLEIAPVDPKWIPTFSELQSEAEKSEDITAREINTWPVKIHENADIGRNSESRDKYGDYTLLIYTWIEDMNYVYFAPTLNFEETIVTVGSMQNQ